MTTTATPATLPEGADPVRELIRRGRTQRMNFDISGYEESVPLLREAIELCPTSAEAYAELSLTYSYWGLRRESSCTGLRRELLVGACVGLNCIRSGRGGERGRGAAGGDRLRSLGEILSAEC